MRFKVLNDVGLSVKIDSFSNVYGYCQLGISHRLPLVHTNIRITNPFNIVHVDVWGLAPISCINGIKYFLLFVDDYTRF